MKEKCDSILLQDMRMTEHACLAILHVMANDGYFFFFFFCGFSRSAGKGEIPVFRRQQDHQRSPGWQGNAMHVVTVTVTVTVTVFWDGKLFMFLARSFFQSWVVVSSLCMWVC